MSKLERCSVDELYVTGFVPSNLVPTDNPNALDPFLHPLVQEIKDGFIDGFEVEHKGGLTGFQPERAVAFDEGERFLIWWVSESS